MTLKWGYLAGTALFTGVLLLLVALQVVSKKFHPFLYWATIIASTNFGTTMADFADSFVGNWIPWRLVDLADQPPRCPRALVLVSRLYLSEHGEHTESGNLLLGAITFSQTLGTALGDWMADSTGLGYEGGALVFAGGLAVVVAAYFWTNFSRVALFWTAFILTRPLGATVGDFLDKPLNHGGLALSRPLASAVIAGFILICLLVLPQRAGAHPGNVEAAS